MNKQTYYKEEMQRIAELLTEANERLSRLTETYNSDNDFSKDFEEVVSSNKATKYFKERRAELSKLVTLANKKINHLYNDTDTIKFTNEYERAVEAIKE